MTQEAFNQLPALLTNRQVRDVTGWSRDELAAEVKAGRIQTYRSAYRRRNYRTGGFFSTARLRYYKSSVARVTGLKL